MKVDLVVKGIILDKQHKKVLLLKRSPKEDIGIGTWENVGGAVEEGESLEEALRREIREEAGLSVKVENLAYASQVGSMIILVYYCVCEGGTVTLSEEHSEARWAGKHECMELLEGGIAEDFLKNGVYNLLDDETTEYGKVLRRGQEI